METLLALRAQYGDVVRLSAWPSPVYLLSHPDAVQQILRGHASNYRKGVLFRGIAALQGQGLLTSEGDLWRQQRRLLQPIFRTAHLARCADSMTEEIQALVDHWRCRARQGKAINIVVWMHRLTFRILARALLGIEQRHLDPLAQRLQVLGRQVFPHLSTVGWRTTIFSSPVQVLRDMRMRRVVANYNDLVQQLISARRLSLGDNASTTRDLLATLITAYDSPSDDRLSAQQLRDEVITLIGAGVETSALVLSWTCYVLARHPETAQRVHQEVQSVTGGRAPVADDLPRLAYTRMVLDEVMRLFPPSAILPRQANADDTVGGYSIPRNAVLLLSQYVTHRHPDFWPDPERFHPERFTPQQIASRHRFAYFPFGAGPRTCIGKPFALLEMHLALATIAQTFQLTLLSEQPVLPHLTTTLQPRGGLWLQATPYF